MINQRFLPVADLCKPQVLLLDDPVASLDASKHVAQRRLHTFAACGVSVAAPAAVVDFAVFDLARAAVDFRTADCLASVVLELSRFVDIVDYRVTEKIS